MTLAILLVVEFRLRGVRGRGHALFRRESLLNAPLFTDPAAWWCLVGCSQPGHGDGVWPKVPTRPRSAVLR